MTTEASRTSKSPTRRKFLAGAGADRRRHGRDAAGVARADRDLEIPVDLADQGHLPRVRGRLRQEGQRHVGRPPQARRARRRRRRARLPDADAVHSGILDGGHGVLRLLVRQAQGLFAVRHPAVVRLGRAQHARPGSMHGGGEALYKELVNDILKLNLVGFLYFPMPTQPLGWFKKEIKIGRRLQGHEIPHRRSFGRRVQGDGRGGHHPAGRRNRAGDGPRPARCGRVQQPVLRHPARLPRRVQVLHDAAATISRWKRFEIIFNKAEVRCAAAPSSRRSCATPRCGARRDQFDMALRPLFEGPRGDQEARRQRHQDAGQACSKRSSRPGTR